MGSTTKEPWFNYSKWQQIYLLSKRSATTLEPVQPLIWRAYRNPSTGVPSWRTQHCTFTYSDNSYGTSDFPFTTEPLFIDIWINVPARTLSDWSKTFWIAAFLHLDIFKAAQLPLKKNALKKQDLRNSNCNQHLILREHTKNYEL